MFLRKNNFILVAICLISFLFIFSSTIFAGSETEAQYKFRLATSDKFWAGHGINAQRLVTAINYTSGGKIAFDIFPNCALGDEKEVLEGIQLGTIDMTIVSASQLSRFTTELSVFTTPFIFKSSLDQMDFMFASEGDKSTPIMEKMLEEASEESGFRILGILMEGSKHACFNIPIKSLDDIKGKKIRLMPNNIEIDAWKNLGMIPNTVPWSELYSSLQNKVFDACELTESDYLLYSFDEVAPYWIGTNHLNYNCAIVISEKAWNSLSTQLQNIVKETSVKVAKIESYLSLGFSEGLLRPIKRRTKEMLFLDEDLQKKMREEVLPKLLDKYDELIGKDVILQLAKSDEIIEQWCIKEGWSLK